MPVQKKSENLLKAPPIFRWYGLFTICPYCVFLDPDNRSIRSVSLVGELTTETTIKFIEEKIKAYTMKQRIET